MSLDEELRALERAAAQGDPAAAARLEELRLRAGLLITVPLVLPPLSATPGDAQVGEVLAAPGARVRKDQVLVTVDLDKISCELVAPADGFVTAVSAAVGAQVPVGGELLQLACAELPDDPWALLATAQAAHAGGQPALALRALERAAPGPADGALLAGRARLYEALGRPAEALACWRALVERAPDDPLRAEALTRVAALEASA